MSVTDLPGLNATLNTLSALLLLAGYIMIKRQKPAVHKKFMVAALVSSAAFLISYLIYHNEVGSVPYPYHDWTRPVYFIILIPHVILAAVMVPFILAAVMVPFILAAVWFALRRRFQTHRKLARRV